MTALMTALMTAPKTAPKTAPADRAPSTPQGARLPRERLSFILGPCGIESRDQCLWVAEALAQAAARLSVVVIFKASFDKANRTRHDAYRGPGLEEGLRVLSDVRAASGLPVLTDIHEPHQAAAAAQAVDALQVPAFLCRQTDLLAAAAQTGKPIHVKKGQFLAPDDMGHVLDKLTAHGAQDVWLCERGAAFGYHDLVVDMRGLVTFQDLVRPVAGGRVVFDATHAAQSPGGPGGVSGGSRRWVPALARGAVAVGVDAVFMEVHPDPPSARSDAATQWPLADLQPLLATLLTIDAAHRAASGL
jgi:2-dehydro-3-deoxyphosphooctonate aldolase (KDO 8-P synthase)